METLPLILCIETSSPVCSVALCRGEKVLSEDVSAELNSHSSVLASMIHNILQKNHFSFSHLNAVAVSAGPGSYTGLRIGMATAKGICYAAEKPLLSISTFDAMVQSFLAKNSTANPSDILIPMIDARRMEVFTRLYDSQGEALGNQLNFIAGEGSLFTEKPKGKLYLFGSGAEKMMPSFTAYDCICDPDTHIRASSLSIPALKKWEKSEYDNLAYTLPNYGKDWQPGK
jgi:tRNA threonylcarbamoyladenosine biosynthesis protein TsaB